MRRLLIGRHPAPATAPEPRTTGWMPGRPWAPPRLAMLVPRLSSNRQPWSRAVMSSLRRPTIAAWSTAFRAEPEVDLSHEWVQVGAYLERMAPDGVSADEIGRAEDAAAERIYQRSRRGRLAGLGAAYSPGSRKRSSPLRRGV